MPKGKANNAEYAGMIYQNPDGTYDYTGPLEGNFRDSNPSAAPAPPATTTVGNYHTHPDYSTWSENIAKDIANIKPGDIARTGDPDNDAFNSDFFSSGDYESYKAATGLYGDFTGDLGTPSGDVKAFNQKNQERQNPESAQETGSNDSNHSEPNHPEPGPYQGHRRHHP